MTSLTASVAGGIFCDAFWLVSELDRLGAGGTLAGDVGICRAAAGERAGEGVALCRRQQRSPPARRCGSTCIWRSRRAGTSTGRTPVILACRPRSIGLCRPGFPRGRSTGRCPERFQLGPIANYGYAGDVDLLVPIDVLAGLDAAAPAHLGATVKYLVCAEICIPGEGELALDLPAGREPPILRRQRGLPRGAGLARRRAV